MAQREGKKEEIRRKKMVEEKGEEKLYELWQAMDFEK